MESKKLGMFVLFYTTYTSVLLTFENMISVMKQLTVFKNLTYIVLTGTAVKRSDLTLCLKDSLSCIFAVKQNVANVTTPS